MKKTKKRLLYGAAVVLWLVVWQLAAMAIGQEVFLVSPNQALGTLLVFLSKPEIFSCLHTPLFPGRKIFNIRKTPARSSTVITRYKMMLSTGA